MILIKKGAEANIYLSRRYERKVILKQRLDKEYRIPELNNRIQSSRTKKEAQIIHKAKESGVPTPIIFLVDQNKAEITMEFIEGRQLKLLLEKLVPEERIKLFRHIGELVGLLHNKGIIHGDLTTSNMILTKEGEIILIDFGLSELGSDIEERGVDLHLLKRALTSRHYKYADSCFESVIEGYKTIMGTEISKQVLTKIKEIGKRGRYIAGR